MPCKMQNGKPEGYHFTECGLDYVYLVNGYSLETDEDGDEVLTVHNSDSLHREIVRNILLHKAELSYQEIRFLRSVLRLTQEQLSRRLHMETRHYQRIESKTENQVMGKACEDLLRIMVWEVYLDEERAYQFFEQNKAERSHYEHLQMLERSDGWQLLEAA